jgi:hypothetical protein
MQRVYHSSAVEPIITLDDMLRRNLPHLAAMGLSLFVIVEVDLDHRPGMENT